MSHDNTISNLFILDTDRRYSCLGLPYLKESISMSMGDQKRSMGLACTNMITKPVKPLLDPTLQSINIGKYICIKRSNPKEGKTRGKAVKEELS